MFSIRRALLLCYPLTSRLFLSDLLFPCTFEHIHNTPSWPLVYTLSRRYPIYIIRHGQITFRQCPVMVNSARPACLSGQCPRCQTRNETQQLTTLADGCNQPRGRPAVRARPQLRRSRRARAGLQALSHPRLAPRAGPRALPRRRPVPSRSLLHTRTAPAALDSSPRTVRISLSFCDMWDPL